MYENYHPINVLNKGPKDFSERTLKGKFDSFQEGSPIPQLLDFQWSYLALDSESFCP